MPLRIALVSEHASPLAVIGGVDAGGQNVHVAALARALADRGHTVTVYTRRDDPTLPRRVPFHPGVTVEHVTAGPAQPVPRDHLLPHMPAFGTYLARAWAEDPPDVVHAHFWMSGVASLLGAWRLNLPVLQTFHALGTVKRRHQGAADTSPKERVAAERDIGLACDRIVATCVDEVRELADMGIPRERTAVVPCGVDVERFTPEGEVWPRTERPRLLQVGRLVPRKGAAVSITALADVPGAELLIAGGPPGPELAEEPEAARLREIAADAGVADRVRLLGGVPPERMPALLRSADLVLCPADYEPFGIVPLEAMAAGVPVLASAVGGQLDTVVDRVTGRLVPPRDPSTLAAAARELISAPGVRRAYGTAGRRRALAHYAWSSVAEATERAYLDVLALRAAEASVTGAA
jgi:glycosyltransferase involved in cell wall biosynthesis